MKLIPLTDSTSAIFDVLIQDYEAEFSSITKKVPDLEGKFTLDSDWKSPNKGFLLLLEDKPAGFVIKSNTDGRSDIAEFYILPCYRKKGLGKDFAFTIFDMFPGPWQVRQIPTATDAIAFWRAVIQDYTHGHFTEDHVSDHHWGKVVRQLFHSRNCNKKSIE
jgi:predicted acetyltransferase